MITLAERVIKIYRDEGATILGEKILGNILYGPSFLFFILFNYYFETRSDVVLLRLRRSTIDADRLSLIESFAENNDISKIYLVVWSKHRYKKNNIIYQNIIEEYNIEIVRVHGFKFITALSTASIINYCHENDFRLHRLIDEDEKKTYIRTYHGIAVKGGIPKESGPDSSILPRPRVDLRPVSSDLELYSRAALEKRDSRNFDKIGYPRYDRIFELKKGHVSPALPTASKETLENNSSFKILYAPTQQTRRKIYSFPEFNPKELENVLLENDIELYVRMHTNEDGQAADELLELENVRYAGRSFSGSSVEILPYMDALITDYSSIYPEFLPFDRPIIFIQDDWFMEKNGIRYDYDKYYPGRKIKCFSEFINHIEQCARQGDEYQEDREFVQKCFNIDTPPKFVPNVKDSRNEI